YTCSPRGPARLPPFATTLTRRAGLSTGRPGPHDFTSVSSRSSARSDHAATSIRPPHSRLAYRDDRAYAPPVEAGYVHDPRFLQKRKRFFPPQRPRTRLLLESSRKMSFFVQVTFRLSWQCHAASSCKSRMVICPTGSGRRPLAVLKLQRDQAS